MTNYAEATPMQTASGAESKSKAATWTGRAISGLVILFMIFDGVTKVLKVPQVIQASARLHLSMADTVGIGIVLLVCTALYAIPRTAILGAILVTGYLGGATAIQLQAQSPAFENVFPVIFGVLVWAGLFLRDAQVRSIMPVRAQR
jgi:uncharacterized membrane protein (UPF0182 family)